MGTDRFRRAGWPVAGLLCAAVLAACGGGGGGSGGGNNGSPGAQQAAQDTATSTVAAYALSRSAGAAPAASSPAPVTSAVADGTRQLAVEELHALVPATGPSTSTNRAAVPLLLLAHLDTLRAAAAGTTASALDASFPESAPLDDWLHRRSPMQRQLWTQRGQALAKDFLQQTDWLDAHKRADWRAGETAAAGASLSQDPAFDAQLQLVNRELQSWLFESETRLAVVDSLQARLAWPAASPFTGRFENEGGVSFMLPMLRLTQDVVRYAEADFVGDALTRDGLTVISIVPTAGTLDDFLRAGRLDAAIRTSAAALSAGASSPLPAGELRLPLIEAAFANSIDAVPGRRGLQLPYDKVNANLKRLDNTGGTYMKLVQPRSRLVIDATGLRFDAAYAGAFVFSPQNVYGPGYGTYASAVIWTLAPDWQLPAQVDCTAVPDLRSHFLVVLDASQAVLAVMTIAAPGGERVQCAI